MGIPSNVTNVIDIDMIHRQPVYVDEPLNDGKFLRRWRNGDVSFHNSNSELYRDGDLPATIRVNGTQEWYQNGLLHRDYLPAAIRANGNYEWWCHGTHVYTSVSGENCEQAYIDKLMEIAMMAYILNS